MFDVLQCYLDMMAPQSAALPYAALPYAALPYQKLAF